jgi:8-oxo-dGTP diphosphatase
MTVVLLRHASAGNRKKWKGDDRLRPLDDRGWEQAHAAAAQLHMLGVRRAVSSPYVRCVQSLQPLGLPIEEDARLAEGACRKDALELLESLDDAVACTHGDVVELLLGRPLKKGEFVLVTGG